MSRLRDCQPRRSYRVWLAAGSTSKATPPCPAGQEPLIPLRISRPAIRPSASAKSVPDCWIELVLTEGKNRQVRRMTAAVGHPTLRLIRVAIGGYCWTRCLPGNGVN